MRAMTLGEVRETLSGAPAAAFFEAWTRIEDERLTAEDEISHLAAQAIIAESRVLLAEETARDAVAQAEEERRRLLAPGVPPELEPLIHREIDALAAAHLQRAARALEEAAERRQRCSAIRAQSAEAVSRLEGARKRRATLRSQVPPIGGCLGESCLFFADAEQPGAAFVVPLVRLSLATRELEGLVLHRLAAGAALEAAVAIRDTPTGEPIAVEDDLDLDPLTPPSERGPHRKESP